MDFNEMKDLIIDSVTLSYWLSPSDKISIYSYFFYQLGWDFDYARKVNYCLKQEKGAIKDE